MTQPLVVHLNRGDLHDVAPTSESYETEGSFDVTFRNHGRAVHVHLKVEGPLSQVVRLGDQNYFVGTDTTKTVRVDVAEEAPATEGWLEVVTGYGSQRSKVAVSLVDDVDGPEVDVDESLSEPPADPDEEGPAVSLGTPGARVALFAVAALVLAGVVVALAPSTTVGLGAATVVVSVVLAAYLLTA